MRTIESLFLYTLLFQNAVSDIIGDPDNILLVWQLKKKRDLVYKVFFPIDEKTRKKEYKIGNYIKENEEKYMLQILKEVIFSD